MWSPILIFLTVFHGSKGLTQGIVTNVTDFGDGVFHFKNSKELVQVPETAYEEELYIYCHNGTDLSVFNFWTTVELRLKIESDNYHLYMERNVSMVKKMYEDHMSSWFYHVLPWKTQVIKLHTFEPSCVGILTRDAYTISLMIKKVDYALVVMTFIGIALFYYAKELCRNVFFHYTTGVGMGIFLSLIVIIYFIQKRVRKSSICRIFLQNSNFSVQRLDGLRSLQLLHCHLYHHYSLVQYQDLPYGTLHLCLRIFGLDGCPKFWYYLSHGSCAKSKDFEPHPVDFASLCFSFSLFLKLSSSCQLEHSLGHAPLGIISRQIKDSNPDSVSVENQET